jgi:hypothetical protein
LPVWQYNHCQNRFNATTAFLLLIEANTDMEGIYIVSMPPRRSCFQPIREPEPIREPRFNATTAFLLRLDGGLARGRV